ncbi:ArnT family glycosyltransferase [Sphingomonas montanisoli]|nr:glycosyltransferase family 39 protein [Sphingomonas montanisoli]
MQNDQSWRWAVPTVIVVAIALWLGWVGFIASDDGLYYFGAVKWVDSPPYSGVDHWTTRFPVELSFAAAIAIFGKGFAAFHAMSLGWCAALLAAVGLTAKRIGGASAGWIAVMLTGTMPVLATFASIVNCDMPELVFMLGGIALLPVGRDDQRKGFAAGLCFGLAFLSRETAILPLVGLVPIFLIGRPVGRCALIAAGVGFFAVQGAEALFQWAVTGDPLHRYGLAINHDDKMDRAANAEGNFLLHPAIDPLLVLLINDDFALLFWLLIPAVIARPWAGLRERAKARLLILAAMAVAAFFVVGALVHELVLNPRYFVLAAVTATIVVALWLVKLRPVLRAVLLMVLVATNFAALSLANRHPHWASEMLVITAQANPKRTIFTDKATYDRAALPLRFAGVRNVKIGAPAAGSLYVCGPCDGAPGEAATPIAPPSTVIGALFRAIGLEGALPGGARKRLSAPGDAAEVRTIR